MWIAMIVDHAFLFLNAMVIRTDGLTAWKRIHGRAFGQPPVWLGDKVEAEVDTEVGPFNKALGPGSPKTGRLKSTGCPSPL